MAEMCIEKKRVGLKHVLNEVDVCPCRCSNLTLEKMKKRTFYTINELSGQPHEDVDRQEGEDDIE